VSGVFVLKFGGAALADGPAVERVCAIVARQAAADGPPPVVVVSAHRGVTDLLESVASAAAEGRSEGRLVRIRHRSLLAQLNLPSDFLDRYWRELERLLAQLRLRARGKLRPAELDLTLSYGERLSARVVAGALDRAGVAAIPVDAWDLGLITDSTHGDARPLEGSARSIRSAIAEMRGVAVVTGFVAKDLRGNLTTLGRNGSDLTASTLAEALDAREIQFWKPVAGILTADPELVSDATPLECVTYAEAAELAFLGAAVLHSGAIAPAVRAGTAVRVCSFENLDEPGTVLVSERERRAPISVVCQEQPNGSATLALVGHGIGELEEHQGLAPRARSLLLDAGIACEEASLGRRVHSQVLAVGAADAARATRLLHAGLIGNSARIRSAGATRRGN
jgi:aspartate kinase